MRMCTGVHEVMILCIPNLAHPPVFSRRRVHLLHLTILQLKALLRAKLGDTVEGALLLSQMGSTHYQMALYSQARLWLLMQIGKVLLSIAAFFA